MSRPRKPRAICIVCENECPRPDNKFFCSKTCRGVYQRGENNPNWRTGEASYKTTDGYVERFLRPDHPMFEMTYSGGRVLEHRLVMAESIGRPLTRSETVHHINGDRTDNRLENLQLRQGNHGNGVVYSCRDCGSGDIVAVRIGE